MIDSIPVFAVPGSDRDLHSAVLLAPGSDRDLHSAVLLAEARMAGEDNPTVTSCRGLPPPTQCGLRRGPLAAARSLI